MPTTTSDSKGTKEPFLPKEEAKDELSAVPEYFGLVLNLKGEKYLAYTVEEESDDVLNEVGFLDKASMPIYKAMSAAFQLHKT